MEENHENSIFDTLYEKNYDEITENLDTILEAGDDCYVIVNDDDLRDELMLAYGNEPSMHLVHKQEAALPEIYRYHAV